MVQPIIIGVCINLHTSLYNCTLSGKRKVLDIATLLFSILPPSNRYVCVEVVYFDKCVKNCMIITSCCRWVTIRLNNFNFCWSKFDLTVFEKEIDAIAKIVHWKMNLSEHLGSNKNLCWVKIKNKKNSKKFVYFEFFYHKILFKHFLTL